MHKLWAKIKAGREYLIQHNILAAILLIVVILASWGASNEADKVKGWAFGGAVAASKNSNDIATLKAQVNAQAATPPVVIIQKETKYEKPFTDADMLARARKLRHEQQSAEKNR
jgi:hypothetical protein